MRAEARYDPEKLGKNASIHLPVRSASAMKAGRADPKITAASVVPPEPPSAKFL
jgi:hypothetical protein